MLITENICIFSAQNNASTLKVFHVPFLSHNSCLLKVTSILTFWVITLIFIWLTSNTLHYCLPHTIVALPIGIFNKWYP